ncbi:MAG: cation:dicarboxylase symporter family transporter [Prevotella sp.]|nr:cation:dicarboxylase symporter family transporter [Prevotella sp.]
MRKFLSNNVTILVLAVVIGILLGKYADHSVVLAAAQTIKSVSSQLIFFLVPLIVLAFVSSAVTSLRSNATSLFLFAFLIAYLSSEASALFSLFLSYSVVPLLHTTPLDVVRTLPEAVFTFAIPPVMNVISALFLAIFLGLGVVWTKAASIATLLTEFRELMLVVVKRVLLPILPFYIAANFYVMAWQGSIDSLIVFLPVIAIIVLAHLVWIVILYSVASLYARKNGFDILRHYAPAYFTALGTMSSAATLGVALHCARKSKVLRADVSEFSIPLFANIHLCGATLTETFFLAVVSQLLYGHLPSLGVFLLFILLLGVFAVGAPGVPGGTAFASVGIITSILGFDDSGVALFLALFALQDCFGTSCNILGDGALSLILQTYNDRINKVNQL